MKTAECEGIEEAGALLAEACPARVESVEPIPGSHNVKAVVDAGALGAKTVVCGAPNCRPGLLTAYVPLGKKVINGVESDGMLASGANSASTAITTGSSNSGALDRLRCPIASSRSTTRASRTVPTSGAITAWRAKWPPFSACELSDPAKLDLLPQGPAAIQIQIEDLDLCPRYSALVFENVTVQPSPLWLQYRLTAIGLNPINNIVDMTNFVMAELAQPMHAFDADLLQGDTIFIRPAKPGEPFRALNDETYTLDPSNLVIADSAGAIALAGVIGGGDSAISEKTTRVVLESANFQASSIRKTSSAIKLRTDASMRFEKAQDPRQHGPRPGARHRTAAGSLARHPPGGRRGRPDARDGAAAPSNFPCHGWQRKLGRAIEPAEVRRILESLAFGVTEAGAGRLLRDRPELARHQRRLHQGRPGGRSRPHGGLRFHHAAGAAGARRRAARQSRAPLPARRAQSLRR